MKYNRALKASSQEIHVCIFCFESNVWRVFWAVTCLSDHYSFCCKDSLLWQREWLAEDYTVPLPCIAGHEELITILMLSRSDRFWLMGNCAGAAHLEERQGKLAPLAPLAQLWSMCGLSMATAIGVSSAQLYTPVKYADCWLLLCYVPVLYPSHRHIPGGHDASLSGHWRGEQGPTSVIEVLTAGSCDWLGLCGTKTIILILPPFLLWCAFVLVGKTPCKSTHLWTWRKKPVETLISVFLLFPLCPLPLVQTELVFSGIEKQTWGDRIGSCTPKLLQQFTQIIFFNVL